MKKKELTYRNIFSAYLT